MIKDNIDTVLKENTSIHDESNAQDQHTDKVQDELVQCKDEVALWEEKYKHLAADFANFKKRLEKDRLQSQILMHTMIFSDLLTVLDNIDRAFAEIEKSVLSQEKKAWLDGFVMIRNSFRKILEKYGINEISFSKIFDPEQHEAVMHVASEQHNPGEIVEILEKGYMMNDRVLRPAKVSIAKE